MSTGIGKLIEITAMQRGCPVQRIFDYTLTPLRSLKEILGVWKTNWYS